MLRSTRLGRSGDSRHAQDPWDSNTQRILSISSRPSSAARRPEIRVKTEEALSAIKFNRCNHSLETLPERPAYRWPENQDAGRPNGCRRRIARTERDRLSIAAKAEFEYLYDKPYPDQKKTLRAAGPFTVENLSPPGVLGVDEDDQLVVIDQKENGGEYGSDRRFRIRPTPSPQSPGVQQAHKEDKITFTAPPLWPGELVCAEGRYLEGGDVRHGEARRLIFIGP